MRQSVAAAEYGVGRNTYIKWERDDFDTTMVPERFPAIGHVTEPEAFVILRFRSGWLVSEVAQAIGCSRYWVNQMERGKAPIARLRDFWAKMEVPTAG